MLTVGLYAKAKRIGEENTKKGKVIIAEMFNENEYAVYLDDAAYLKRHGISDSNYIYRFGQKEIDVIMAIPDTTMMVITKDIMESIKDNLN